MKTYHRIFFGITMFFFILLLTVYTTYGLQDIFPYATNSILLYQSRGMGIFCISVIILVFFQKPHHIINKWQIFLINGAVVTMIAQIIYSFFLIFNDILNSIFSINNGILNWIGFAAGVLFLLVSTYGSRYGKYRYTIHNKTIYFEDLPATFDGIKILQISDIHSGSFNNRKAVEKGIELIKKQNADIFVFTGDLVNNDAYEFNDWKDTFSGITAPLGQYSILGNHDYGDYVGRSNHDEKENNMERLKKHHADIGWRLLLDEHIKIEKNGESIVIAGVENRGDSFSRYGDLQKTLDGIEHNLFTVLLSHDPSHRTKQIKKHPKHIHITLSGHTHGMQLGFDFSRFKRSPIKYRYKHRAGLYHDKGQYLYVNRGFGFLGLSARVGMWPEITIIEVKKKK